MGQFDDDSADGNLASAAHPNGSLDGMGVCRLRKSVARDEQILSTLLPGLSASPPRLAFQSHPGPGPVCLSNVKSARARRWKPRWAASIHPRPQSDCFSRSTRNSRRRRRPRLSLRPVSFNTLLFVSLPPPSPGGGQPNKRPPQLQ